MKGKNTTTNFVNPPHPNNQQYHMKALSPPAKKETKNINITGCRGIHRDLMWWNKGMKKI